MRWFKLTRLIVSQEQRLVLKAQRRVVGTLILFYWTEHSNVKNCDYTRRSIFHLRISPLFSWGVLNLCTLVTHISTFKSLFYKKSYIYLKNNRRSISISFLEPCIKVPFIYYWVINPVPCILNFSDTVIYPILCKKKFQMDFFHSKFYKLYICQLKRSFL